MSRLPMAAETLLRAMMSGSVDRVVAALHHNASVHVGGKAYSAIHLSHWAEAFVGRAPLDVRVMSRGGSREEPVLTVLIYRTSDIEGPFTWSMRISDDRILRLSMSDSQRPEVPFVVERFLDAVNHGNLPALMQCFADEALVNDELVEYFGRERIRGWGGRHVIGRKLALHAVSCVVSLERAIVTAQVTGEFDVRGLPDPLVLSLYFSLVGDKISQLVILQNLGQDPSA